MTTSLYAWIIDRDHLERSLNEFNHNEPVGCEGVYGPRGANGDTKAALDANYEHHHTFEMRDDDGILYVTGTLYWNGDPEFEVTYMPLRDYGAPAMGCVRVSYPGHPEWDCG
ncbi:MULTISPECIES: hypothetical protein [Mycolicibacter]|uniref:Uncharacterized protein n=1 Tax=Mycolicibacter longobardus TaxID=1108812 RepID=A0A1X1YAG0_9MYCO|nr:MULTISPECIES: hypothetical protein [Mycolicibacter]ORW08078.1 hypothetical protein AWC16_20300 [Mycolicibacter longobardus]RAV04276.1 hypothetical protein DQP56_00210 [Mycolicibacter senuensis]